MFLRTRCTENYCNGSKSASSIMLNFACFIHLKIFFFFKENKTNTSWLYIHNCLLEAGRHESDTNIPQQESKSVHLHSVWMTGVTVIITWRKVCVFVIVSDVWYHVLMRLSLQKEYKL